MHIYQICLIILQYKYMAIFKNQNFITQIAKAQGCEELDPQVAVCLQLLVQMEARMLVETAGKFMRNDHRTQLEIEDIEQSLQSMDHKNLILSVPQTQKYKKDTSHGQYLRVDPIYKNPLQFIQKQFSDINVRYSAPTLKGRWIYIDGSIPKVTENYNLKSLQDLKAVLLKEQQEKGKKFHVIRDQPMSIHTRQQLDYYDLVTQALLSDSQSTNPALLEPTGNIASIFPQFLAFLFNTQITDKSVKFMISLLHNVFIKRIIESNLHQIVIYLMAYQGQQSFRVGLALGNIVKQYCNKYPILRDIFTNYIGLDEINEHSSPSQKILLYSFILKQIGFQLVLGIPAKITQKVLKMCKMDSFKQEDMDKEITLQEQKMKAIAGLCFREIATYWGQLSYLREIQFSQWASTSEVYWLPNLLDGKNQDTYLYMNL